MSTGFILKGDGTDDALTVMADLASKVLDLAMVNAVREYKLDCPHEITVTGIVHLVNGVYPSWIPVEARNKRINKYASAILPAVFVLVNDYENGNGSLFDFRRANRRLYANGVRCADIVYKWYDPRRFIVRRHLKQLTQLCSMYGQPAYVKAVKKARQRNENNEEN